MLYEISRMDLGNFWKHVWHLELSDLELYMSKGIHQRSQTLQSIR